MRWKPNVTVAAVIEQNGRYLLVEERSKGRIVINQPAGHLEQGESLLKAVQREVWEETAWRFTPQSVIGLYLYPCSNSDITYLRVCFHGTCHDHQADQALDDGILRTLWLSRDDLDDHSDRLRSPMVLRCIDDFMAGHRFPLEYLKHSLPSDQLVSAG